MYLKKIKLKNIKCFADLELDFSNGDNGVRMWTTLFGRNGVGKSSLLQAMGAVLAGPSAVRQLIPVADGWVRKGAHYGEIYAEILWSEGDATGSGQKRKNKPYLMQYLVGGGDHEKLPPSLEEKPSAVELVPWSGDRDPKRKEALTKDRKLLTQTAYAEGEGWLACGYGPFRRLSGGSEASNSIVAAERRAARFVTLFKEDAALTNATQWLIDLHNTAREGNDENKRVLETVKRTFTEKLFPEPAELIVTAKSAMLRRGTNTEILFHDLSDGYRSMLALAVDLLRWIVKAFPKDAEPLKCPGVVLIDELDSHLHPSWQRTIGYWLKQKFPHIQFVIATHSPFLAQVSDSVPALEDDGTSQHPGIIILKEKDGAVEASCAQEDPAVLTPDQILLSPMFEMESLRPPLLEEKLNDHARLVAKAKHGSLSPEERERREQLSLFIDRLPLAAEADDRRVQRVLREKVMAKADLIREIK